jgi:hypothetical protein
VATKPEQKPWLRQLCLHLSIPRNRTIKPGQGYGARTKKPALLTWRALERRQPVGQSSHGHAAGVSASGSAASLRVYRVRQLTSSHSTEISVWSECVSESQRASETRESSKPVCPQVPRAWSGARRQKHCTGSVARGFVTPAFLNMCGTYDGKPTPRPWIARNTLSTAVLAS